MAKSKTGKKTRAEHPFHGEMIPPDDPIFKLGFVVGQINSSNFSRSTPEKGSPNKSGSQSRPASTKKNSK